MYDKAIKIDSKYVSAFNNKGYHNNYYNLIRIFT